MFAFSPPFRGVCKRAVSILVTYYEVYFLSNAQIMEATGNQLDLHLV